MSFFDWLEIQWARLNIWLDYRKQYPGEKISVKHVEGDRFSILRTRSARPENVKEWEAFQAEKQAEVERRNRLEALMTPEQRAAEEAKRTRMEAGLRERSGK